MLQNGTQVTGPVCLALSGDSVELVAREPVDWLLAAPVRRAWGNMNESPSGPAVDTLLYSLSPLAHSTCGFAFEAGLSPALPDTGTFYIIAVEPGQDLPDTLATPEPLHAALDGAVQISVRPDDTITGYMMEGLGTPFLMSPRRTPGGYHQADERMGFDCASLAVYGARRAGLEVDYASPDDLLDVLQPVIPGLFSACGGMDPCICLDTGGCTAAVGENGIWPGDILHFMCQVTVFLDDRGVTGVLDTEDLVIQSWFDGPHVCSLGENGFRGRSFRVLRFASSLESP